MRKNRRTLQWAALFAVAALSFPCLSSAQDAAPSSLTNSGRDGSRDTKAEPIRALLAQMTEAFNRGDVIGASASFTPDGEMITGDGTRIVSPVEIEHFLSQLLTKLPKGTQFVATVTNVSFARPDVAVLSSEGGWLFPGETMISDKNQGVQSLIALKQKGTWHVVLFQRTRKQATLPAPK